MKRLSNWKRVERLIDRAIEKMALDLTDLTVLTEAASGAFAVTALAAARAGAKRVYAVARTSPYGELSEVLSYNREFADKLGVLDRIEFSGKPASHFASAADIVTNLGFVRRIDSDIVVRLPRTAVVCLMWEPWEFRESDIDLAACKAAGIPVIGTCETDRRLRTFEYVGVLALKLMLESGIECLGSRILVIGSDPFGSAVLETMRSVGAVPELLRLPSHSCCLDDIYGSRVGDADCMVLVEHRDHRELIGDAGICADRFRLSGCQVIHIAGALDVAALDRNGVSKYPPKRVEPGYMTLTTDYVGPKSVIDLHVGGLKVGEVAVRVRRAGGTIEEAIHATEIMGLGLRLNL